MATGVLLSTWSARANVYATDIKLNGSLSTITDAGAAPVAITYRLNQAATLGVTVAIFQGTNLVDTLVGGTNFGLNTVVWGVTNNSNATVSSGTYSLSITAAASGFTNWTQISLDTNAGYYAFDPNGMAVDINTNSPYYGRVVVGCSYANGTATNPVSGEIIKDGIYKMNADGTFADEGGFGFGGYTNDDGGHLSTNEMPSASFVVPWRLRIGEDDRIYMLDYSDEGAISAFDMQVTTNQVVIDDGSGAPFYGALGGIHTYIGNPDVGDLTYGIGNFDVSSTTTTNAAIWLCDNDYPNWGIWMYRLKNGQSDTNDSGTQAVTTGADLALVSSGGCSIDNHLNIFCGETRSHENAVYDVMEFTNWNNGLLPPRSSGFNFTDGTTNGQVNWGYNCEVDTTCTNDPTFEGVSDVVINSRSNPTMVACPMVAGDDSTNGIRVLDATNGAIIVTNLDFGQQYPCAAWDNVGNLYGASSTRNLWKVWSPPGTNTNTTVAVPLIIIAPSSSFLISSTAAVATGSGSATVTISFTAPGNPAASSFTVVGAPTLNGIYSPVAADITGASGSYQATFTNSTTAFFKIKD